MKAKSASPVDVGVKDTTANLLIYRIGSIGDTVVALPCLKLIARAYPGANRIILTNFPRKGEAAVKLVLGSTGLAHDYIGYPVGMRGIRKSLALRHQIVSLQVDTLIYLTPRHGLINVLRDIAFFRACRISRIIGAPVSSSLRNWRYDGESKLWENEGSRLARCLKPIGEAALSDPKSWCLELNGSERLAAGEALDGWSGSSKFIAVAAGAKTSAKDWGVRNWIDAITRLNQIVPDWGLAFIGSSEDALPAEEIAAQWKGPTINLCGTLTPRISAAVIERAKLFLGHDGGPMHLAAAVGAPIVAVFSARAYPGTWFPFQETAEVIYPSGPCFCRGREQCRVGKQSCILSIKPEEVFAACRRQIEAVESRKRYREQ
jgi:heptosyltransferase III